jgi:hypothetical protein
MKKVSIAMLFLLSGFLFHMKAMDIDPDGGWFSQETEYNCIRYCHPTCPPNRGKVILCNDSWWGSCTPGQCDADPCRFGEVCT